MISNVTENVRIRSEGSPFEVTSDVIVEVLRDGAWEYYQGFNSLSDDYAFTNAREAAERAVKTLAIPA
jgi:hypothetical protein